MLLLPFRALPCRQRRKRSLHSYEGGTGYVSGEFLSDEVPASTENNSDDDSSVYTGNVVSVFDEYGTAYTLYQTKDGLWRDNDGTAYSRKSETEFQAWEGNKILSIYNYGPDNYDYSDQEGEGNMQYCWKCGQWFEAGYEFDNHYCPG